MLDIIIGLSLVLALLVTALGALWGIGMFGESE
jgi:hypothetical protein